MPTRRTAVLRIRRPGVVGDAPLDREREYGFELRVDGLPVTGGTFTSTLGDEKWTTFVHTLNRATGAGDETARELHEPLETIRDVGRRLYEYLSRLVPELTSFLEAGRGPRRLVIESQHGEVHKLPWEAMIRPDWSIPADDDLSIVHTSENALFRPDPLVGDTPLRVAAAFGPDADSTKDALQHIARANTGRVEMFEWQPASGGDAPDADLYHVEAHGARETGVIDIGLELGQTTPLAERLRGRAMVLLWSCYSALPRSWGASPAFTLNERGNALVLAFQTELHKESAPDIATRFYRDVFTNRDVGDPETAIVRARARLYKERLNSCEWAAMTVWLRQPVDVTAAALDGPRLPAVSWRDGAAMTDEQKHLRAVLANEAHPGRVLLVDNAPATPPFPLGLVEGYRGMVVHVGGDLRSGSGLKEVIEALDAKPLSAHAADGLLAIVEVLSRIPDSLLLWTDVDDDQQRAAGLLPISPGLRIVLTAPFSLTPADGVFASVHRGNAIRGPTADAHSALDRLERKERAGRYTEASEICERQRDAADKLSSEEQRRFWTTGYWIGVRLGHDAAAVKPYLDRLESIDEFEAALLRGNLDDRSGQYDDARRHYARAQDLAQTDTQRGRFRIEMAYLASQLGDAALAEAHYRAALRLLESVNEGDADERWRSALSRGLRDYAHLIAREPARVAEATARLTRAIAMHAIDGRLGQLPAAFATRGRIERTLKRGDLGERALIQAVALQQESGNLRGWVSSIQDLASLHFDAGHYELAFQLMINAYPRVESGGERMRESAGLVALAAARAAWRLGRFPEARYWIAQAAARIPLARRDERLTLDKLAAVLSSLGTNASPPGA